jgi:hypothetical protein
MKLKYYLVLFCSFYLFVSCKNELTQSASSSEIEAAPSSEKTEKKEKQLSPEEKVSLIDKAVKKIESLPLRKVISNYRNPDIKYYYDIADYHAYYDGNELKKVEDYVGEEGYSNVVSFYFKDKKVFFCTYESSYGDSQYLLRKIYIENDEAFWIVNKEKGPQDENTNFSDAKEIVLKDVDFANAIKLFKEDFEGSMKRFKVSKTEE